MQKLTTNAHTEEGQWTEAYHNSSTSTLCSGELKTLPTNVDLHIHLFSLYVMRQHCCTNYIDLLIYHISPKYSDTSTPYHTCSKI